MDTAEWADTLYQAPPETLIPTDPIDVDGVGLRKVYAYIKCYVFTFVDAGGGGITLDLAV